MQLKVQPYEMAVLSVSVVRFMALLYQVRLASLVLVL
jgi:hypothetical protein